METISNSWRGERLFSGLITVWAALFIALLTAAAAPAAPPDPSSKNTFNSSCASCHGQSGKGDTAMAKSLQVPDLSSAVVQKQSDTQLRQIITDGVGNMPPFKDSLTADQINSLVAYVRTLSKQRK